MSKNPRLVRAIKGIKRRMFLKAIGAGLAAPAAFRLARVATAATGVAPKRFVVLYMPHGVAPEHYAPRVSVSDPTSFALDQTNVSILGPLEPYKSYVNVYQGFQYVGAAQTHEGIVNCLTGSTATDTTTPRTSIDQLIAKGLGVKPWVLGACSHRPYGMDNDGMLFWDGTPIDPEKNPVKAADALFGGSTGPTPPVNYDVQLRQDLLALTAGEVQGLKNELSGLTSEQTKLGVHLDAVTALIADANKPSQSVCTGPTRLPTVEQVRTASAGIVLAPDNSNDYFYQEQNFRLLFKAQMEVIAQAITCNAAQVMALMPMYATCEFDFSFLGIKAGGHHTALSHTWHQQTPSATYNSPLTVDNFLAETRQDFATAQRWFAQQLVDNIVSVLATADDPAAPGTKVLDNTLIFWMSEIGDGAEHTRDSEIEYPQVPASLPLVTIGKAGGALKTGQVVNFPVDVKDKATMVNRPASDLYLTMARAMGVQNATIPNSTGAITEVLA